ncbi:MAG: HD domain-containing protein [Oscillospiraceae bacterium]|nr:HD domain-containing protein [Oscillospiraceae bacterium]
MNRTKAEQVFRSYTDNYDSSDVKIKLKIYHTFRVAEIADRIAEGIGADRDFAWLSGLLHDIGRFEQVKRYGTFYDAVSIDHAELSADILFKDGLFAEFEKALFSDTGSDEIIFLNEDKKKLLETVIRLHNKLTVPDGLDEETLMYTRILRDADKADIFRVLTEPPYDGRNERIINSAVPASEKVMSLVMERRCVPRGITETEFESLVSHCCMAFELEYKVSRDIVAKQGYLDVLMNLDAKNDTVRDQLKTVRDEMKKCWSEAER